MRFFRITGHTGLIEFCRASVPRLQYLQFGFLISHGTPPVGAIHEVRLVMTRWTKTCCCNKTSASGDDQTLTDAAEDAVYATRAVSAGSPH